MTILATAAHNETAAFSLLFIAGIALGLATVFLTMRFGLAGFAGGFLMLIAAGAWIAVAYGII